MSAIDDAELTQELEVLVAAKEAQQRTMKLMFALAALAVVLAIFFRHHFGFALLLAAGAVFGTILGVKAHLRAAALRGQALEKILAEAFRRAGKDSPEVEP